MSFEREPKIQSPELKAALNSLGEAINDSETNSREFETETGFKIRMNQFENDSRTIHLSKNGQTSNFSITKGELLFNDLIGAGDKPLDDPAIISIHKEIALNLHAKNKLELFDIDSEGQLEMDV